MSPAKVLAFVGSEARREAVTSEDFRQVMRELASGVVLLTSAFEGKRAGCAVSAVVSVSLDPASLLVCLSGDSSTLSCIRASGTFAINVLADRHCALAQRFAAAKVRGEDRFAEGDWSSAEPYAPHLRDALAIVDCRLERVVDHATHAIVIGACVAASKGEPGPALLHWRSRFESLG